MSPRTSTQLHIETDAITKLALLSGVLGKPPSIIVTELLEAAYPDHIVEKIKHSTHPIKRQKPVVTWVDEAEAPEKKEVHI